MTRSILTIYSFAGTVLFLAQCGAPAKPMIEDLSSGISTELQSVELIGRRDGDRMPVLAKLQGLDQPITLSLELRIGVPTTLTAGSYRWQRRGELLEGVVRARSLTFLGGQSDHPNLGGVFELLAGEGSAIFKVTLPTLEVRPR